VDKTGNTNTTNNNGGNLSDKLPTSIVYFAYSKNFINLLQYFNLNNAKNGKRCKFNNYSNNLPQPTSVPYQPPTTSPEQTQAIIDQPTPRLKHVGVMLHQNMASFNPRDVINMAIPRQQQRVKMLTGKKDKPTTIIVVKHIKN